MSPKETLLACGEDAWWMIMEQGENLCWSQTSIKIGSVSAPWSLGGNCRLVAKSGTAMDLIFRLLLRGTAD